MPAARFGSLALLGVTLLPFTEGSRYSSSALDLDLLGSADEALGGQPAAVPGYSFKRKASCRARTLDQGRMSGDIAAQCKAKCETAKACECFEVTTSRCRIAVMKSRKLKRASLPTNTAYVRDLNYTNPDVECRAGDLESVPGNCHMFKICQSGRFEEKNCSHSLAFNPKRGRCDWPGMVPSCSEEGIESETLPGVGCGDKEFVLASESTLKMQEWIRLEIEDWWARIRQSLEIESRPEGFAATSILRTAGIDTIARSGGNESTIRWAIFSREVDGRLTMQSVALVQTTATGDGPTVDIMAIVSRRALFNDEKVRRGAGKALISGILNTVHGMFPDLPLTLIGVPGDKFVEKAYIAHGMQEYGRDERGYPKLRIVYPAACVDWMASKVLCKEMTWQDYAAIAWRLLPGSGYVKETCAHLMPPSLFMTEIGKMIGLR